MNFLILVLDVLRQVFVKYTLHVQSLLAAFVRTVNLLKIVDLVYDVMVKTGLTKLVFVLTVGQVKLFEFVFIARRHVAIANLADCYIF